MAKAAKKSKRKSLPKVSDRGDAKLIRSCVKYAQAIAAGSAGFNVDPNPSSDIAEPLLDKFDDEADRLISRISNMPATTALGLQAKARMAAIAIADDDGLMRDELSKFFSSLADDIRKYLDPVIHEEWIKQIKDKQAA